MKYIGALLLVVRGGMGALFVIFTIRSVFVTHETVAAIFFGLDAYLVLSPAKYDPAIRFKEWVEGWKS